MLPLRVVPFIRCFNEIHFASLVGDYSEPETMTYSCILHVAAGRVAVVLHESLHRRLDTNTGSVASLADRVGSLLSSANRNPEPFESLEEPGVCRLYSHSLQADPFGRVPC